MAGLSLLRTVETPFGGLKLKDFDLVTTGSGPLLVGTHPDGACSWDLVQDRWTVHRLNNPCRPENGSDLLVAPSALAALVVDGRVVIGASGRQPFAQWDLDSGAVRVPADPEGFRVDTVRTLQHPDRSLFVGSTAAEVTAIWDAGGTGERVAELSTWCDRSSATGAIGHHQALVTRDVDSICLWDIEERFRFVEFDSHVETEEGEEMLSSFALADLGGRRPRLVAIGERGSLVLGDVESAEWDEPVALPVEPYGGGWSVVTGAVDGLPIAVASTTYRLYPGADFTTTLCAWGLERRRPLGEPVAVRGGGLIGAEFTELDGRPVVVAVGHEAVRVWVLDR